MSVPEGLSAKEARIRLDKYGPNVLDSHSRNSSWVLLIRQFTSPIILILFVATIISMFLGEVIDGFIILAIIIPSGLLGFWQEHRASKTMRTLMSQVTVHVEVIRDGQEVAIPIAEVVVGDLVALRAGDLIPADLRVVVATGLLVDESALTGESFPREKSVGAIDLTKPIVERNSELFYGTHVVSGVGQGEVSKIGKDTEFGALASELNSRDVTTGFERGTSAFGMLLLRTMVVLVSGLFVANLILHRPIIDSLLFSLALAVGLTPQLLPVIISVSLAAGARRMAEKKVLVKRLDAIEDFGLMTALCTDKTGTITEGAIRLDKALGLDGLEDEKVLRLAFINAKSQKGFVNPLDAAIVSSVGDRFPQVSVLDEIPYDFERRRLTVLVDDNDPLMVTKGAFDSIMNICTQVRINCELRSISSEGLQLQKRFEEISGQGNRVLGIASKSLPGQKKVSSVDESEMVFEGLLVFHDPLKSDAAEAINELAGLGIDLYLITGDNRFAAKSIASQVGLASDVVMIGSEIAAVDDQVLKEHVRACRVFAEVDPIQKERVILALRASGATVGYFGDGINDAAALHAADVGISADTAVDVAKNAASIVLLDRDLRVIAEGVRIGRRTFVNTMKYVRVGVSAAFGNMFSLAISDMFLPFLPLLPMQILLLNFMTDFPAIAISGDLVDEEDVAKPRAWDIKAIRKFMIYFGLLSSVFDLITFAILRIGFHASATLFRSGWFVESTLTELTVMLVLRTRRRFWQSKPGEGLLWSSVILALLTVAIPFTAFGRLIGLQALPLPLLLILFALIAVYAALNEAAKKYWMK
jgi:Mg2+-importing ATPase